MRDTATSDGLTALAVAGTNVVMLGWDMPAAQIRAQDVLGFAIGRQRASDHEVRWMQGMKTFASVEPNPAPGVPVSSFLHPFQTFQWADYSVSPGKTYTYTIVAKMGPAAALQDGSTVTLTVKTEPVDVGVHAIFFNRGAVASQEYARRFQNQRPDIVGQAAFDWLSRGLVEGLETFIGTAGAGSELFGAFFEFKNARIYDALNAARGRGAHIEILYDGDSQREANEEALNGSGIEDLTKAREHSAGFAHNKFLVLREAGTSTVVWTGSTNLSQNGIFGHSNNAHLVRDENIAESYFQYWKILKADKTRKPTTEAVAALGPIPPPVLNDGMLTVFSPRPTLAALDWYADIAGHAQRALFMTFAFGMNERFVNVYDQEDDVLRFALMEKKGNGAQYKKQAEQVDRIRKLPNTVVAVGHKVELNNFDRWLEEIDRITDEQHVLYVHTKYMLVDPLGATPIVIVGSANFSVASTDTNDENMLVIRGNAAVADVYLGEFMRLFSHYAFRESLRFKENLTPTGALQRKHLAEDPEWIEGGGNPNAGYFTPGTDRALRRLYFSGQ
jgi:phosphatidylserine/phosphatidylglycerophosphate/cardiolipin synthase-like enzyme